MGGGIVLGQDSVEIYREFEGDQGLGGEEGGES
jgi:hypothetical protein